jgi:hypothetical protein
MMSVRFGARSQSRWRLDQVRTSAVPVCHRHPVADSLRSRLLSWTAVVPVLAVVVLAGT